MASPRSRARRSITVILIALALGVGGCHRAKDGASGGKENGFRGRGTGSQAFYVRPAGAGAKDGSSWANAMSGLPSVLERGATYWLASGQYDGYSFDDPARRGAITTVRKATAGSHGSDDGWRREYGRGQAVLGPLRFTTGHYTLDGGERNGIKTIGQIGTEAVVQIDGSHVVLRQIEIDGGLRKANGKQIAGACNGSNVNEDYAVFDRCEVHNIADDGIGIYASHVVILASEIHNLDGCGTDGDCGPCYNGHSDGIEISGASDIELVGNLVYDVRSNAALYMDDWSGSAVRDLLVFNNVFYTPDTGFAVYLQKLSRAKVHNNVIWGKTQGNRYGGLSVGPDVENLEMFNNIILNINYSHMGGIHAPEHHALDFNLFGMVSSEEYSVAEHDLVTDPRFTDIPMSGDASDHKRSGVHLDGFKPTAEQAIDTGTTPGGVPARDVVGTPRPQGSAWDRGPFESTR